LYVHCWGGHGRTGTLLAVMLSWLYGLPYAATLKHVQACHDSRIFPQAVRSPQTPVQRAQVGVGVGVDRRPSAAAAAAPAALRLAPLCGPT
jgi:hypothetical protein